MTATLKDLLEHEAREPRRESPAEAVARIRQLREGLSLDGLAIKDLVNEAAKY